MSIEISARSRGATLSDEERKVLTATLVGTTIEWYDFFVYAQAAGLVFGALFFAPMNANNPLLAQIISFATLGLSFLFRPLGAIVCGHLGDRFGRKNMLVVTLLLMGAATALVGLLPTYAQIGAWAPALLILLRILQGFSAGGEWGGAALMSVESAPRDRRSFFGSFPQIGTPLGMILATGVLWVLTATLGKQAMIEWGWRIPFLLSIVLIVVGIVIRRTVEESPVFKAMQRRHKESSAPLRELMRNHSKEILRTALIFMANNAAGYILIAFIISYGTNTLKMPSEQLLLIGTLAAVSWFIFTLLGGILGDKIGRVRCFQIGYGLMVLGGADVVSDRQQEFAAVLHQRRRPHHRARIVLWPAGGALCRAVSGQGALFRCLDRLRARRHLRRSLRADDRAMDHRHLRPVLARRRLYRGAVADLADHGVDDQGSAGRRFERQRGGGLNRRAD